MSKKFKRKKRTNADIMKEITKNIIEALKGGKIAWQKPWINKVLPMNYTTKKPYSGINLWITLFSDFDSPYWLTYKQTKTLKGNVKKGEKGTKITFWKILTKPMVDENGAPILNKNGNQKIQKIFLLKDYTIFNAEQIEGIEFEDPNKLAEGAKNIKSADELVALYTNKPRLLHTNEPIACYSYNDFDEFINMPKKDTFKSTNGYYATLFHELAHSTGHKSRLNRDSIMTRTKDNYSVEELTAEMSSCLMMANAKLEIEPTKNNKAYIQGWISKLENDHKFIFQASREAQKACNYMMKIEETNYETKKKSCKV